MLGRRAPNGLRKRCAQRTGAAFSIEMMMVITVLIPMMFALTEFSLLWSAKHLLQAAAYEGARAAAMPALTEEDRCLAAQAAIEAVLVKERFLEDYEMTCDAGMLQGDMVHVQVELPMTSAAPDLLGIIGISIEDELLIVQAVTARQN